MTKKTIKICAVLLSLSITGCAAPSGDPMPYPTFTPLAGFQILGADASEQEAPATQTTEIQTTPIPSEAVSAETATPEVSISPTPGSGNPEQEALITLVFTGQIVPARCVQAEADRRGEADYIYQDVKDILAGADLTVGTLNAALTDYPPMTGCVETFVLVGKPYHADAMAGAGIDLLSLATNHIKNCGLTNCGDRAFLDTLANVKRAGILQVGAGLNEAKAAAPLVVEIKGVRLGFVSLGQIEPMAFAGPDRPGIGVLTEENLNKAIAAAKKQADFVIFLPHWGPEYSRLPNASQRSLAQSAVEAGADLIVGNHTHYIQAFVTIGGIPVYFSLGNFVFDQTQEPERQQSLLVRITLRGTQIVSTELIPAVNDRSGRVRIADESEAAEILSIMRGINADVQADYP